MVQYNPLPYLPSAEELPGSDNTPVDNELQDLIPHLLKAILSLLWENRHDWFFGVDMGIYYTYTPGIRPTPIIPDGFVSLGVERHKNPPKGRLSYVLWEENNIPPTLVIEVVSQSYGGEYDQKQAKYVQLGVLYYVIYNPDYWQLHQHEPLEVYRLIDGKYVRQLSEPVWIPEINLGIGRGQGTYGGWTREWLYWYDEQINRFPTPEEVAQQERQRAELAEQQLENLIAKLRERGINPDNL